MKTPIFPIIPYAAESQTFKAKDMKKLEVQKYNVGARYCKSPEQQGGQRIGNTKKNGR